MFVSFLFVFLCLRHRPNNNAGTLFGLFMESFLQLNEIFRFCVFWPVHILNFPQEVCSWYQAALLGQIRSIYLLCGSPGQPAEDPRGPGKRKGRAQGSDRRPQCFVMIKAIPAVACFFSAELYNFQHVTRPVYSYFCAVPPVWCWVVACCQCLAGKQRF